MYQASGDLRFTGHIGRVITSYSIHYTKLYEDALRQGDLPSLSRLMAQSHHSLIENVAVTFEPGEKLVASLAEALDQDGGVRMLSSGAVLVLLPDFRVEELSARVMQLYPGFTGLAATRNNFV